MTTQDSSEALAKALETNWWGLNGHIGQEAADKLRTALHSEGYTIVSEAGLERLRAELESIRGALVTVAQWDSWASEWLAKHPLRSALEEATREEATSE